MTDSDNPDELETDDRFPSGPWEGFFLQPGDTQRFRMELSLEFKNGQMQGEGEDYVGEFLIRGRYQTDDGKCRWTKHYIGRHAVFYDGYNEGKGIWGLWEIPQVWNGGFHIWPQGMADPTGHRNSEAKDLPQDIEWETTESESLEPSGLPAD